jgi:hypothetical protein
MGIVHTVNRINPYLNKKYHHHYVIRSGCLTVITIAAEIVVSTSKSL